MSIKLLTVEQVADGFGITTEKLLALRKRHGWPVVKLGRFEIRFTEQQVAEIIAKHTEIRATAADARRPAKPLPGQTRRSAARGQA